MGCGGSKQQDVATGNTVSTGKLSQKEVAASKSKASSSTTSTDVGSADESLKSIVEKAEMAETNGGLQGNEKPTTSMVVEVTEEEQLTTKAQEDGMEKELKEIETKAQEEEKEEVGLKDDDGDSIGKRSNDFEETLSAEEMDEGETVTAEKKIVREGELVSGSSAQ